MKKYSLIFTALLFFYANITFCQQTSTYCQKLSKNSKDTKKVSFKDSVLSFNNYYVASNVLKNIKESTYPIELRYYVSTVNRNVVNIYILQSNSDSTKITKLETLVMEGSVKGFKPVKELHKLRNRNSLNMLVRSQDVVVPEHLCNLYDLLLKNRFFEPIEKIAVDKTLLREDGYGGFFFELKLDRNFRNFEDRIAVNYENKINEQEKYLLNIVQFLQKKF